MTSTRARRRMAAVMLTGAFTGTGALHPAGASEGACSTQAAVNAAKSGNPSEGDREASKEGLVRPREEGVLRHHRMTSQCHEKHKTRRGS